MTARSRQAGTFAYRLTQLVGLHVSCEYLGNGRDRAYSGWHVSWGNGPTIEEMQAHVAALAQHYPAIARADLRYDRGCTDLGEAVALLRHLDAHPAEAPSISVFAGQLAFDDVSYPERSDEVWLERGRALLSLSRHGSLTGDVVRQLADRAVRGWPAVLAWLDAIAAAADNPDVIDLDHHRARALARGGRRA